jgi:DNA-binding CsgD family transcriptional regulator
VVYSFLTFLGLGFALTKAYLHQKNVLLAGITIVISIILMLMQIMFSNIVKINHYDLLSVISLFSHTVLAMLVLVLAKSWMFEESATEHNFAEVELSDKFSKLQIEYSTVNDQNQILKNEIESLNTNRVLLESKILQGKDALQIKDLSEREVSVLRLINKSYSEIAELLFISRETVITHKKNIEGKLGISGKENLVQYAIEKGLIIP